MSQISGLTQIGFFESVTLLSSLGNIVSYNIFTVVNVGHGEAQENNPVEYEKAIADYRTLDFK